MYVQCLSPSSPTCVQAEYDGIVVRMIHRLCAVGKAGTLQFLPHVALDAVSSAGAWAVLCVLCQV